MTKNSSRHSSADNTRRNGDIERTMQNDGWFWIEDTGELNSKNSDCE